MFFTVLQVGLFEDNFAVSSQCVLMFRECFTSFKILPWSRYWFRFSMNKSLLLWATIRGTRLKVCFALLPSKVFLHFSILRSKSLPKRFEYFRCNGRRRNKPEIHGQDKKFYPRNIYSTCNNTHLFPTYFVSYNDILPYFCTKIKRLKNWYGRPTIWFYTPS